MISFPCNPSSQTEIDFNAVFSVIIDTIRHHCLEEYQLPIEVWEWFEKSLIHNTTGGKCNRGCTVVNTARLLFDRSLTPNETFQASVLGWMVELLQAMMLVLDDIMDASITRRGKSCWYRVPGVGMMAVNDAAMLESAIYLLLKRYFRDHPAYVDIMELLHETTLQIELGQTFDMLTAPPASSQTINDLNRFTLSKYTQIVTYKTAYYTFYLPVALALLYANTATPQNLIQAKSILIPMGKYFQAQDDYLDVFGDPAVLGKIGTDIRDNKCSWLVNQALLSCSAEQRTVLEENYGRDDEVCERTVKELYGILGLEGVYREFEERTVAELRRKIARVDESQGLKMELFETLLERIYRREK
ncbi:ERG20 farnesyl diphosphate synthase [Penicillium taxi]|uniref:ERG20 farnesyl diphosphate synthase n=1 Tax=Penicillium taxi TaxID=168475 RepID=UPI002544D7AA|nr:ERG20 farnesyl diphosphate synthase [Penicillium taxi]KAJ5909054.1 ERG20 farnesyl diphosphate synthase [Penicillium taxi]